jgi:hypothetical protein
MEDTRSETGTGTYISQIARSIVLYKFFLFLLLERKDLNLVLNIVAATSIKK